MVGAIRLEQLILEVVANVSRDAWVPLSIEGLQKQLRKLDPESNGASFIALAEAIMALELAGFLSIQKHDGPSWLLRYDRAMLRDELYKLQYFGGDKFELRLTHKARKGLDKGQQTPAASKRAKVPSGDRIRPAGYRFHPEIERVSGQLFRDGHHKQAALEAYIRVIDEVKAKSGLGLDGDPLMNQAFGCDKQTPVIQFNSLQSDAERDEQKGILFLFKGVVGLRNSKAHSNTLFNDPSRAHEYLALASLLMRLLEIATVNRKP
jgi:uncharacterized protein (TIGR02391 family)